MWVAAEGGNVLNTKTVGAIALIAVIVLAVAWGIMRTRQSEEQPEWQLQQKATFLDEETLQPYTRTLGEWKTLGSENGRFKNPDTGKFTLAQPMTCAACGGQIPTPRYPAGLSEKELLAKEAEVRKTHLCPKCGKLAFAQE